MRQRKGAPAETERGGSEKLKQILGVLDKARFEPYVEPVKCSSLYSETQLQKSLAEGICESLTHLKSVEEKPLFREVHHYSNVILLLGLYQIVSGGFCCLLPFKTTPHWMIILLAINFFIGAMGALFFEWFITDGVVMTVDDANLAGAEEQKSPNGLALICHFNKETKNVRFAVAPALTLTDSFALASRKAAKLLRSFHLFLYHIVWRVQTSGLAISAHQKDESLRIAYVKSLQQDETDEDEARWEWVETPGSIPVDQQFGCISDVVRFRNNKDKSEAPPQQTKLRSGTSALILERPVVRFFDETGTLLSEPLNKDLKSLLAKFYEEHLHVSD
eukprot:Blabericola_migrator_1__4745@NODE_24_length_21460_cov_93_666994_g21_i0_p7_GENE_NODE_24_length_21460_cov_93_666994_g21_i0NODE_24_length_21460_cov_93_666994_g21_i0_p7_ORF_typecomplete_len333_score67_28SPC25/PF06703_11/1_2e07PsaX/PF08078_12/0_043ARD/PF03079_14/0_067_NODE_24_length_21460_cov_93_666994_g21_i068137811